MHIPEGQCQMLMIVVDPYASQWQDQGRLHPANQDSYLCTCRVNGMIIEHDYYEVPWPPAGEWMCAASPIRRITPPSWSDVDLSGLSGTNRVKNRSAMEEWVLNRVDHKTSDISTGF